MKRPVYGLQYIAIVPTEKQYKKYGGIYYANNDNE